MPVFLPARLGVSQSEALAEAYAHAKVGEPELFTIALYHSTFIDDEGAPTAIYCVNAYAPLLATIEAGASIHAGEEVTFRPMPMRITRPEETDTGAPPEVSLELDNVSREVMPYVKAASETDEPITITMRIYLASDTSAPHENPPTTMVLRNVNATASTVSARVGYGDLANRRFPKTDYSRDTHPGLYA